MLDLLTDPHAWASLATLTVLEIVLGIDNIIFLSIVSSRLPEKRQPLARRLGLLGALGMRIALLASIAWIMSLSQPVFAIWGQDVSWRDMILISGGLFLLTKSTREIHNEMEAEDEKSHYARVTFLGAIVQIMALDLIFSIDSVITAVGMADHLEIMIAAVTISIAVMMVAAEPVARFVRDHPTVKMLALSFLLMIGVALIADGAHFHIPRGYLYFAVAFSGGVEVLNQLAARARKRRQARAKG